MTFIVADHEIPDWLVKTPGTMQNEIRLDIYSWFANIGFSKSDSFWGLLFLFNTIKQENFDFPLLGF